MSISALFGTRLVLVKPNPTLSSPSSSLSPAKVGAPVIECSSRPQKKGTKHHMKTRPKKTQPWDMKRGPAVYAPLPPLPPDWTLSSSESTIEVAVAAPSPPSEKAEV